MDLQLHIRSKLTMYFNHLFCGHRNIHKSNLTSVYAFSSIWWLIQHTQNKNTESNTHKRDKLIEFALTTTFVDLIIVLLVNDNGRWIPDEIRWYCIVAIALLVSVISALFAIKEQEQ